MKEQVKEDALRITTQFRSGEAMIYDFRNRTGCLTLRVSGRGGGQGPPTEWHIEASTSTSPDSAVVAEWAATRTEALRAVGDSWDRKRVAGNLPVIDWDTVARAMSAVRAL